MIVINKKRLTLIITSIFLAVFIFVFTTDSIEENKNYISTVSLPVSEKVIIIDAGHGKPDERCGKFKRDNRGGNKSKNSVEASKLIRAKWINCNTNTFR